MGCGPPWAYNGSKTDSRGRMEGWTMDEESDRFHLSDFLVPLLSCASIGGTSVISYPAPFHSSVDRHCTEGQYGSAPKGPIFRRFLHLR
jgi:hypothetical protein